MLVRSGSLPRSLHAKLYDARESEKDAQEVLPDHKSASVEVSSSLNDANCQSHHSGSSFQIATSAHAEPHVTTSTAPQSSTHEDSLVDSILAVAMRHSVHQTDDEKPTTPLSAPSSHYAVPTSDVSTSSSFPQAEASTSQKEKRMSIEEERERRRSNIVQSTRAIRSVST